MVFSLKKHDGIWGYYEDNIINIAKNMYMQEILRFNKRLMNDYIPSIQDIFSLKYPELGKHHRTPNLRMAECFDYMDEKNVPNSQSILEQTAAKFQRCDGTHMPMVYVSRLKFSGWPKFGS